MPLCRQYSIALLKADQPAGEELFEQFEIHPLG